MDSLTIRATKPSKRRLVPDDVWRITLIPEGNGPRMAIRMRAFLKGALRRHGLRCVDMDGGAANVLERLTRRQVPC